jgi:hypothetical protein
MARRSARRRWAAAAVAILTGAFSEGILAPDTGAAIVCRHPRKAQRVRLASGCSLAVSQQDCERRYELLPEDLGLAGVVLLGRGRRAVPALRPEAPVHRPRVHERVLRRGAPQSRLFVTGCV